MRIYFVSDCSIFLTKLLLTRNSLILPFRNLPLGCLVRGKIQQRDSVMLRNSYQGTAAEIPQWILRVVVVFLAPSSLTAMALWTQTPPCNTRFLCQVLLGFFKQEGPKDNPRHRENVLVISLHISVYSQGAKNLLDSFLNSVKDWSQSKGPVAIGGLTFGTPKENELSICKTSQSQDTFPPRLELEVIFETATVILSASQESSIENSRQYVRLQRKIYWCLIGLNPTLCW